MWWVSAHARPLLKKRLETVVSEQYPGKYPTGYLEVVDAFTVIAERLFGEHLYMAVHRANTGGFDVPLLASEREQFAGQAIEDTFMDLEALLEVPADQLPKDFPAWEVEGEVPSVSEIVSQTYGLQQTLSNNERVSQP